MAYYNKQLKSWFKSPTTSKRAMVGINSVRRNSTFRNSTSSRSSSGSSSRNSSINRFKTQNRKSYKNNWDLVISNKYQKAWKNKNPNSRYKIKTIVNDNKAKSEMYYLDKPESIKKTFEVKTKQYF